MQIRTARPDDVAALAAINAEVHAIHLAAEPQRYRPNTAAEIEDWFRRTLEDAATAVLVAEIGAAVVGYAVVGLMQFPGHVFGQPRRFAEVHQLGVTAGARRRGIGRALMAAAEAQARAWGVAELELTVVGFNRDALRFYLGLGYQTRQTRLARGM